MNIQLATKLNVSILNDNFVSLLSGILRSQYYYLTHNKNISKSEFQRTWSNFRILLGCIFIYYHICNQQNVLGCINGKVGKVCDAKMTKTHRVKRNSRLTVLPQDRKNSLKIVLVKYYFQFWYFSVHVVCWWTRAAYTPLLSPVFQFWVVVLVGGPEVWMALSGSN